MNVVVVESPTKAKTINKYLGPGYTVLASYGHVRDLPPKDGSVRPDEDFEVSWEIDARSAKHLGAIARVLKGATHLYLATDPDREGEAISWHVAEALRERNVLGHVDVKRVVFHEVTRDAVLEAMSNPREVNQEMVRAYLARRALDYLVGFTLSPVLWRKLPGSRSAGRVQSVALRLVCERESEIEVFKPREYWGIEADFTTINGDRFTARLTHLDSKKLGKYDLSDEAAARTAAAAVASRDFVVVGTEKSRVRRNPQPPFTTSTMQQEASRKLRISASRAMRVAQSLYEGVDIGGETVGLISYMRTDSVSLSREALTGSRAAIDQLYGAAYLPGTPRQYRTKSKNAQEAHEAIRPTDMTRHPRDVARHLDDAEHRLYELIWKRTIASQMESAVFDQVGADLTTPDGGTVLRATGSTLVFDGFLKVYQEGRDEPADAEERNSRTLPPLVEGDAVARGEVRPEQHFTQPPPRYTEASLVKRMEELGIGRPSTYASILEILKVRDYVHLDKGRFVPEDRGRVVTAFLENFFERYVQYNFTAELENQLDEISNGQADWKAVLRNFWDAFHAAVEGTKELSITEVIDALDAALGPHFFPIDGEGADARACPRCDDGRLGLKLGKFGAFVGCSNYPDCRHTRPLAITAPGAGDGGGADDGPRELGHDGESGKSITVRKGPYGPYIQLGEPEGKAKPKRVSLPKGVEPAGVDLDLARSLLALPRTVGAHPETGKPILAGIGRYGPYIQHDGAYKSIESLDEVLTIGLNRAVALLQEARKGGGTVLRTLGAHPADGQDVAVLSGRYGPYIKHGRTNAPMPKGKTPEALTMDEAVTLLATRKAAKGSKKAGAGRKSGAGKPAATKKRAAAKPDAP
jgi:DNA topoisomerase-1